MATNRPKIPLIKMDANKRNTVRLNGCMVEPELYDRVKRCTKQKGLRESDVTRIAIEEYLTRNNFL